MFANILKRRERSQAAAQSRPGAPRVGVFGRSLSDWAAGRSATGRSVERESFFGSVAQGSAPVSSGRPASGRVAARGSAPVALPDPVVSSPTRPGLAYQRHAAMRQGGVRQRIFQALQSGATVPAAAAQAGIPVVLAEVVVDEMRRVGLLSDAQSFCASGLGACEGGTSTEAQIHCAACPLVGLKKAS